MHSRRQYATHCQTNSKSIAVRLTPSSQGSSRQYTRCIAPGDSNGSTGSDLICDMTSGVSSIGPIRLANAPRKMILSDLNLRMKRGRQDASGAFLSSTGQRTQVSLSWKSRPDSTLIKASYNDNNDVKDVVVNDAATRRLFLAQFVATSLLTIPQITYADDDTNTDKIDPTVTLPKITSKVYLDIKLPTYKEPRRLTIGLFEEDMPKAAGNFKTLCTNVEQPSYAGTNFYRVISNTSIQGGAIGKDVNSGKSGMSSFEDGQPFEPDNYNILHTKKGLVSGVRNPNGTIDSRFFIQTESDAGWADSRYAAFGIVLEDDTGSEGDGGMGLVKKISQAEVKTPQNSPKDPILIVGCGVL
eukprot:scaffold17957_cov79-Cyclotella_meneghiniana.AAC.10